MFFKVFMIFTGLECTSVVYHLNSNLYGPTLYSRALLLHIYLFVSSAWLFGHFGMLANDFVPCLVQFSNSLHKSIESFP